MIAPTEILWALIGLILTIGGTFIEASIATPTWSWSQHGIAIRSLEVSYQVGAVLLVSCVGGKNAGALSQIAYLTLGLTWLPVFSQGGGLSYCQQPSFGYLVGFIPGAWLCGFLAFKGRPRLETLVFSCVCGLACIHLAGLSYLAVTHLFNWAPGATIPLMEATLKYSVHHLKGQLAVACAATVLAFVLRKILLY
ncbi:MAG: biotin transporter BioY [Hormoscilla sp. GUM202]|nr:biotin transporter BioY [Hormoscilla sp. GUM202]